MAKIEGYADVRAIKFVRHSQGVEYGLEPKAGVRIERNLDPLRRGVIPDFAKMIANNEIPLF
jgi:hypothetical protein